MQSAVYHTPALLDASVEGLNVQRDGTYIDATFGGGGHSRAIMSRLGEKGRLYAFDQDEDAFSNRMDDPRFVFVWSNFRFLKNFMRYYGVEKVDGVLADLGVSSHHFDLPERGFSFRLDGKLDMRMNRRSPVMAADIVENYTAEQLADIFYLYGELRSSRKIAEAIVSARRTRKIKTTGQLVEVVSPCIDKRQEKKELAQIFQALRIEVNQEMAVLRHMLSSANDLVKPGGRIVVLTYHSLEDRLVKNFFKTGNFEGRPQKDFFGRMEAPLRLVNNKVIVADEEEVLRNPRVRSAKLRIAEKL
ncbi:MAG: 16S rRNA (cytosine(1402)-N(4))-methyltransferase RsmH [Porphyromonadaceae bacterium]|nr:16S rRNA (cytosine(1402)-N(4))-methyltransferase RsmH [Porphyromonadaceae bacterium]